MQSGQFYIHKRSLDCFILVTKVQYRDEKRIKIKCNWFTMGFTGNSWCVQYGSKAEIPLENLKDWDYFNPTSENIIEFRRKQHETALRGSVDILAK